MIQSLLIDGDEHGNKLLAEVDGEMVTFIMVRIENNNGSMRVLRHHFATVHKSMLIALAEALK